MLERINQFASKKSLIFSTFVLFVCLSLFFAVFNWKDERNISQSNNVIADQITSADERKPIDEQTKAKVLENYGKLPLHFEPNNGQINSADVKFTSRGDGYNLFLSSASAKLVLSRPISASKDKDNLPNKTDQIKIVENENAALKLKQTKTNDSVNKEAVVEEREESLIEMNLLGANSQSEAKAIEQLEGKSNYFIGNDPSEWKTNVANYKKVRFEEVYSGIDIEYYGNQRQLEYDFIVQPNADPKQIKLNFDGVEGIRINKGGDLILKTKEKGEEIRQKKPFIYQTTEDGNRTEIAGKYKIKDGAVNFEIGEYDKSKQLVIDPIVLVYSSYLGGSFYDIGLSVAVDKQGNAYITGETKSTNFPVVNALRPVGGADGVISFAFITKINSAGNAFIYSTYLGGHLSYGNSIAVDSAGNAYITGRACRNDFPTVNAIQPNLNGLCDSFVTKINPTGNALLYSTYLGGSRDDGSNGIAIDSAGNAYVTGFTCSTNFPVVNALQTENRGGCNGNQGGDIFITKINTTGSAFIYSTYFGGTFSDEGKSIAVDPTGNAYITGSTRSNDFPVNNARQQTFGGNFFDVFVSKINSSGSSVVYSTYLGGGGDELAYGIAADSEGNAYVTGETSSLNFPVSNAIQSRIGGAATDAFVTKYNPTGSAYIYSTYLGGANREIGTSIATDDNGNAYIAGITDSTDFPTINALLSNNQDIFIPGTFTRGEGFITKLNSTGNRFLFSSYFGGNGVDNVKGIAADNNGNVYLTGVTHSSTFPVKNAIQPNLSRNQDPTISLNADGFISKLSIPTKFVSGHIATASGQPLSGVQLSSSGNTENKTLSSNTGDYMIDLVQGNNHTFSPTFSSHRFSPPAYTFNPLAQNQSNVNFTATLINDNFADAVQLNGASGNVSGNNQDATRQAGEPNHANQSGNKSVWYKIRPSLTSEAAFSTFGSSFDTVLSVYTGTGVNNLTKIAEDDDAASFDPTSRVTFRAVAGTDYWIAVDGKQANQSGNFKINFYTTSVTVSGVVTKQNVPQEGLTVRATSRDNSTVVYATTDSAGRYSLTVPAGSYVLAVLQGNLQQGRAVILDDLSSDSTQNIEIFIDPSNPPPFNSIGSIRLPSNATISGLQAFAETIGGVTVPCQTFENATRFVCTGLIPGVDYLIKVTSPNYNFSPSYIALNNVQSNFTNLKFEATHNLSGRVVNGTNRVNGVAITVTGNTPQGQPFTTITNANGEYIVQVPTGYNYIIKPSLTGMAFNPPQSPEFVNLNNHQTADFSVVNSCSYQVTPASPQILATGAESQTLAISTDQNCSWTAVSNDPWIRVNQQSISGAGSRNVIYSVLENPATTSRIGTMIVAGKTITINQSGANSSNPTQRSTLFDFDGDKRADLSVFRSGNWFINGTQSGFYGINWGLQTDILAPADFDGDGRTDVAVYRDGVWYSLNSSDGSMKTTQFGITGDIPVPADFTGDSKADVAVFRPANGTWYWLNSTTNQFSGVQFGVNGDKPLLGDFDGDGRSDLAVVRVTDGNLFWYLIRSSTNQFEAVQFGLSTDKTAAADFDGDGKTDVSVFRESNGTWYRLNSSQNNLFTAVQFGQSGDVPVPADYDGDAKADVAVFRAGVWYRLNSSTNQFTGEQFGISTDKAVPNAFLR